MAAVIVLAALVAMAGVVFASGEPDKPAAAQAVSLTYWCGLNPNPGATAEDYNDVPFYQELEKRTGVKVDYLHPPVGQEGEQFNLMVASGDLPDVIQYGWVNYPGGPMKAIADKVILDHTDLIQKNAPNLKKYLDAHPLTAKMVVTDSKRSYTFPFIRGHDTLMVFYGMQLRQDYLKELGLAVPETIDDWYRTLTALKTRKSVAYPLTMAGTSGMFWGDCLVSAFKIRWDFSMEGTKVL